VLRAHAGASGGGQVSFSNVTQDVEHAPYPTRGVIGLERGPVPSLFRLTDINAGMAPGVPFLRLDAGPAGQNWPANMIAADNAVASGVSTYSVTTGTGWTVNAVNTGVATPVPVAP
jgi:hypothetical protein